MTSHRSDLLAGAALLILIVFLQAQAISRQSWTMDEPFHLLAGDQLWREGVNVLNWEHPPLVKMIAALPLSGLGSPFVGVVTVDQGLAESQRLFADPALSRRLRIASRAAVALVVVPALLLGCFALGRILGGTPAGLVLAGIAGCWFALVAHLPLLQTDGAVTAAFALVVWASIALVKSPTLARGAALGVLCGLAFAAKFSALLLAPTVLLALLLAPGTGKMKTARIALVAGVALTVVWSVYALTNRRYSPELGRQTVLAYCEGRSNLVVDERLRQHCASLLALQARSPIAAQIATGLLGIHAQNEIGIFPSVAFGEISSQGKWWYFPAVLALKTSLVLVVTALVALRQLLRRRDRPTPAPSSSQLWLLVVLPVATYLGSAMASSYNVGARHLLPILPLLVAPLAVWVSRTRLRRNAVLAALALESLLLCPHWMGATNLWWLGERAPFRQALVTGDVEYEQGLVVLAEQARRRGWSSLGILLPGLTDLEAGSYDFPAHALDPGDPLPPGWYAVSVLAEVGLPAVERATEGGLHDLAGHRRLAAGLRPALDCLLAAPGPGERVASFRIVRLKGGCGEH
ncbi:MAG TPA: glycosyltransferase family 39 protein [Thermoanaerobaculia bacterium]|nr:glycosyltransferase family 39 protein [Thermoanaerobaculia bacterium]